MMPVKKTMCVKLIIVGIFGGVLFVTNTWAVAEPIARLTFSRQEFQSFALGATHEAQETDLSPLLCRLFAISDPTLTDHTGESTCHNLEHDVVLTDMRHLDLNQDGLPDVVALVNDPSMASPTGVMMVYSVHAGWAAQLIPTYRAEIAETLIDVNRDGEHEICVKSIIGHVGVLEQTWVDVYAWNGEAYVERNAEFLNSFYRQRYLPRLAERIQDAHDMLIHEVRRETMMSMLRDSRTALRRIATLSKDRERTHSGSFPQSQTFSSQLEEIGRQLDEIHTLSQQREAHDRILSILERTHDELLECSKQSNAEVK